MKQEAAVRRPDGYEECFSAFLTAKMGKPDRFGMFESYFDTQKLMAVREKYGHALYSLCRSDILRYMAYVTEGESALDLFEKEARVKELRDIWTGLKPAVKAATDATTRVALIRERTKAHNEFFDLLNRYGYRSGGADVKFNYIALVDEMLPKHRLCIVGRVNQEDLSITLDRNYDPVERRWIRE